MGNEMVLAAASQREARPPAAVGLQQVRRQREEEQRQRRDHRRHGVERHHRHQRKGDGADGGAREVNGDAKEEKPGLEGKEKEAKVVADAKPPNLKHIKASGRRAQKLHSYSNLTLSKLKQPATDGGTGDGTTTATGTTAETAATAITGNTGPAATATAMTTAPAEAVKTVPVREGRICHPCHLIDTCRRRKKTKWLW